MKVVIELDEQESRDLINICDQMKIAPKEFIKTSTVRSINYKLGVREKVKRALEIEDPFDDPIFDNRKDISFEDKVTEKCVAWAREREQPGSITGQKVKYGDKFRHGFRLTDPVYC